MAHELEIVDGKAMMAYAGDVPWHGLGTKVSPDLAPIQMMEAAGLDWEVAEAESFVRFNDQEIKTGMKSLVRVTDGKVLTNVGKNWHPCQNEEAFNFFNDFIAAGDMQMHTAGSLNDGKIIWALAKVNESFDAVDGDRVDSYMLFSNPHTYGKSIDIRFTPIRVVCNNTLSFSLQHASKNSTKMYHRTAFDPSVAKQQLGIASSKFLKYKEMSRFLASKRFDMNSLLEFYSTAFPHTAKDAVDVTPKVVADLSRNGQKAFEVLDKQPGAEFAEGSWWQALNSVTYVTDHLYGHNDNNRLASQWFGTNQTRKINAANKAVELATAA